MAAATSGTNIAVGKVLVVDEKKTGDLLWKLGHVNGFEDAAGQAIALGSEQRLLSRPT